MRRREFITLVLGGAVAWPGAGRGQQIPDIPRVGYVYPGPSATAASRVEAIISGLRLSGFASPAQVEMVVRTTNGDPALLAPMVEEVFAGKVNVFVAAGPPVLVVARKAARTIPIVALDLESDPLANGVAASLAHPGGNITGVFMDFPNFAAKWLELLVESSPKLSRVAVLWDPVTGPVQMEAVKKAAASMKIELNIFEVQRLSDFDPAFTAASQGGVGAMAILSSPLIDSNMQILSDLALRHRLPAITLFPDFARAGGFLAYGPNLLDLLRQVGVMSGKVLRGAKPADLPIERPTKFELVLNLRTAKALGLSISQGLLSRADEVIE
jgi:putative tryptophan/tyrosine transport system substrate-binding protein